VSYRTDPPADVRPEDIPWDQPVTVQDCANDYNRPDAARSRAELDKSATRDLR
jgi:hypothetical protein